ncbi:hypothetical protein ACWKSR_12410, partial [Campylobacter fetus subsp. venerealis]
KPTENTPLPDQQPLTPLDTISKNPTSSIDLKRLSFENRRGVNTDNYSFDTLPSNLESPAAGSAETKTNLLEAFRKESLKKRIT